MVRNMCDEILNIVPIFRRAVLAPLEDISVELLNKQIVHHKMSIGQIAVHCTAWITYFLSDPKPWKVVEWTCVPVKYPLTIDSVIKIVDDGFRTMISILQEVNDSKLDEIDGKKGPGYIILRLLNHINAHSHQMSYLRQLENPNWDFGGNFGDMASALISLSYHTTRDLNVQGF